jgi:hypothetical protein
MLKVGDEVQTVKNVDLLFAASQFTDAFNSQIRDK